MLRYDYSGRNLRCQNQSIESLRLRTLMLWECFLGSRLCAWSYCYACRVGCIGVVTVDDISLIQIWHFPYGWKQTYLGPFDHSILEWQPCDHHRPQRTIWFEPRNLFGFSSSWIFQWLLILFCVYIPWFLFSRNIFMM